MEVDRRVEGRRLDPSADTVYVKTDKHVLSASAGGMDRSRAVEMAVIVARAAVERLLG